MQPKLDDLYKVGIEAFEKGEYKESERLFHEILIAAEAFEKALAINPGYTEASLNLAITYSDLGKYEKAREVFERAAHFTNEGGRAMAAAGNDPFIKASSPTNIFASGTCTPI